MGERTDRIRTNRRVVRRPPTIRNRVEGQDQIVDILELRKLTSRLLFVKERHLWERNVLAVFLTRNRIGIAHVRRSTTDRLQHNHRDKRSQVVFAGRGNTFLVIQRMIQAHRNLLFVHAPRRANVTAWGGIAIAVIRLHELMDGVTHLDGFFHRFLAHAHFLRVIDELASLPLDFLSVFLGKVETLTTRRAMVAHRIAIARLVEKLVCADCTLTSPEYFVHGLVRIYNAVRRANRHGRIVADSAQDTRVLQSLLGSQNNHVILGCLPGLKRNVLDTARSMLGAGVGGIAACLHHCPRLVRQSCDLVI